jgi:hypothetical protein
MSFSCLTRLSPAVEMTDEMISGLNLHYPYMSYPYLHTAARATPYLDVAEYRRDTLGLFRYIRDKSGEKHSVIDNFHSASSLHTPSNIDVPYRMFIMGSMDDEIVEGVDERGQHEVRRGTRTNLFPSFLSRHLSIGSDFTEFIEVTERNIEEIGIEICIISPSEGLKEGSTLLPQYVNQLKMLISKMEVGRDDYSRFADFINDEYNLAIYFKYIRIRWFYTPWIYREIEKREEHILMLDIGEKDDDGKRKSDDGERKSDDGERKSDDGERKSDDGERKGNKFVYSSNKFIMNKRPYEMKQLPSIVLCEKDGYTERGVVINGVLNDDIMTTALAEYATNDDLLFVAAFSELCGEFVKQQNINRCRILTLNYTIFLRFPLQPQRFISNWKNIVGTNVIHYMPERLYYVIQGTQRVWWVDGYAEIGRDRCIKRGENEIKFKKGGYVIRPVGKCVLSITDVMV